MSASIRTIHEDTRQSIASRVKAVIQHTCAAYGASYDLDYQFSYAAVLNDAKVSQLVMDSAAPVSYTHLDVYKRQGVQGKLNFEYPEDADILLLDGHELQASMEALRRFSDIDSVMDAGTYHEETKVLAQQVTYLVCSCLLYTSRCV